MAIVELTNLAIDMASGRYKHKILTTSNIGKRIATKKIFQPL